MPTKRRFIIFAIILALMMLIKRALGQETVVWEPDTGVLDGSTSTGLDADLYGPMWAGIVCGVISGLIRVKNRIWVETYAQERAANIIQLHLQ